MLITQAKPNPLGKDRFRHLTPATQLAGEWVDLKNNTNKDISLSNLELQHVAYTSMYPNEVWEKVFSVNWIFPAGTVLRIHSGGKILLEQLVPIDRVGADYHAFSGKNYVWNNNRSDTPRIVDTVRRVVIDQASYSANPPEGKILVRTGGHLL